MKFIKFFIWVLCIYSLNNYAHFVPDEKSQEIMSSFKPIYEGRTYLDGYMKLANSTAHHEQWKFILREVSSLPNGSLAQMVPEFSPQNTLDIVLYITPSGLENSMVVLEEMIHIDQICGTHVPLSSKTSMSSFTNPFHWAETFTNAQLGSPTAMKKIIASELQAINALPGYISQHENSPLLISQRLDFVNDYYKARKNQAEDMFKEASSFEKVESKKRSTEWDKQKSKFDDLEKHPEKLNDLIAKNDRKGVRKLLEEYLPWPLMEPTEKKMWEEWLEALENPNPSEKVLTFRGLDDDVIPRNAKGEPYLMSTVLTKNQGNYTRRLRSLTTMREKFGVEHYMHKFENLIGDYKGNPNLTVMMLNHMGEAKGSPFLSTSNSTVASNFGATKKAAILIDKRRIMMNSQNYAISSERERLIPLIIFPDEIVHLEESKLDDLKQPLPIKEKDFLAEVERKIGRPLTQEEKTNYGQTNTEFVREATKETNDLFLNPKSHPKFIDCNIVGPKNCECLFSTLNALLKN